MKKLVDKIKEFEPSCFFEWVNLISIHPSNQEQLLRFELITLAFFTIEEDEFLSQKNSRDDICNFFEGITDDFSSLFAIVEDYVPFDQNKLIPLLINGDSYYFFYGLLENPYTRINVLSKVFNDIDFNAYPVLNSLKIDFFSSLNIQTNLLTSIVGDKESEEKSDGVHIPSQDYFDKYSHLLRLPFNSSNFCSLGCVNLKEDELIEACFNYKLPSLLKKLFTSINGTSYIVLPHLHLEFFGYHLKILINIENKYRDVWENVYAEFQNRVKLQCLKFFSSQSYIYSIIANRQSTDNLLDKYDIACCFIVDQNKLILFKTIRHNESKDIKSANEAIAKAQNDINNFKEELLASEEIGLGQYNYEHFYGASPKKLELWYVLVNETISLEMESFSLPKDESNTHYVEIGDLAFVFDKLFEFRTDAPLHFVKFLENDRDFMNSPSSMFILNYTDRIVMYLSGDRFYLRMGKLPDMLNIAAHQGNDYESEYYYNKYKNKVYETVKRKFYEKFNLVECIEEDVYHVVDTAFIQNIYLVDIEDYPIFIYPPMESMALSRIEHEFLSLTFPQLFAHYIRKFKPEFIKILKESGIYPKEYGILITSNIALKQKENSIPHLLQYTDIDEDLPFYITTKLMEGHAVKTFIIANTRNIESILNMFADEDNSAERYCINRLIRSVYEFRKDEDAERKANEFIEKHMPLSKKAYSLNQLYTENPLLDRYTAPIKINTSDIAKANKLFAEHLAKMAIKPGEYIGSIAKEINGDIFDYLQGLLEETIKQYTKDIILFAYHQLELSEGERAINTLKNGMNTKRDIQYDLKERVMTELNETINRSAYSKHIIQSILKVNPNGEKEITKSDWTFLLGIVAALVETSQIYEYIHYDLSPHKMIISELYEITTEKLSDKVNHEKWQNEFLENEIHNSENAVRKSKEALKQISEPAVEKDEKEESILRKKIGELDRTYIEEYGYSLVNSLYILYALYRSSFSSSPYFPLSIVSMQDIILYINELYPEIEDSEIEKIIKAFALTFHTYTQHDRMIPTELLRSRNRLNICPIIKLNEHEYIFGNQQCNISNKLWRNDIADGDVPFKEESEKVLSVLDEIHQLNSKALETEISIYLKEILGDRNVVLNLKKFNRISNDLPKDAPCGEIDILCVNSESKTIFVFEAKSVLQQNRPYNIRQIFNDFFGTTGRRAKKYLLKLNKKHGFVNDNMSKFVEYFGLKYNSDWKVKKAFVVDKKILAAYHVDSNVDFLLLDDLENYVLE